MSGFDFLRTIRTLVEHEVRFVLIGGLAGRLHGSTTVTNDVDACYERSTPNLERLAGALRGLDARLRGAPEDVPFQLDAPSLAAGDRFTFETDAGGLDCLASPAGVAGFEELERAAVVMDLDGITVPVASIDDLIRMKRAAGRPKDLIELEVLGALRDEIDEGSRRERHGRDGGEA
ncbi:MAG TPA: hypothetical protein VE754_05705 [Actinomycetota bacterium]|jgi:hypothetical protein|nr:hypothetical protein [Actinomycetota bacterium]